MCSTDVFLGLLAIIFPPIAVWVKTGICSVDSLINILLCCLGYLPGLLHAWYIIAKFPDVVEYEVLAQDAEAGRGGLSRVTYVYVQPAPQNRPAVQGYGTTAPVAQTVRQSQDGAWNAEGSSAAAPPPSYEHAVGDHKVQTK